MSALTPPLKWAGGKRWLVPYLKPLWETHRTRRLVEPFCGGLAVTLGLMPERALINDVNPHLMNFYHWLRAGLTLDFVPSDNNADIFYTRRERFNHLLTNGQVHSQEAAQLFYYLNRTCFNGLCRFNRSGQYNVPFGKYAKINYMTTQDAARYSAILARWDYSVGDFESVTLHPDDFIYADPPYDVQFTQYSQGGFDWDDQVRLAQWLSRHNGPVIISNQATDRIVQLYQRYGFAIQIVTAPRMINSTGDRTPAQEVIALRNITLSVEKPQQMSLF